MFTHLDFEFVNDSAAIALTMEEQLSDDPRDLRFFAKMKSKIGHDRVDVKHCSGLFHRSNKSRSMERSKVARRGQMSFA